MDLIDQESPAMLLAECLSMLLLLVYCYTEANKYTIALTWALLNTSDFIQRLTLESCLAK